MVLSGGLVAQALPLVQITWPHVDAAAWRRYTEFLAERTGDHEAGALALGDPEDYLNGLVVYEVEQDIHHGRVLTVHLFTAVDLANSVAPVQALLDGAATKAMDLSCNSLQIRLYNEQAALGARLRSLGLSDRAGYLWKRIAPL
jgi:hypothetical protein